MRIRRVRTLLLGGLLAAALACTALSRVPEDEEDLRCPSGGSFAVLNDRAVEKPAPEYPEEARRKGIKGAVVVFVLVDEEGRVRKARACTGPRELRRASEDASRKARLRPTLLSGVPVAVRGMLTYSFPPKDEGRASKATPDDPRN